MIKSQETLQAFSSSFLKKLELSSNDFSNGTTFCWVQSQDSLSRSSRDFLHPNYRKLDSVESGILGEEKRQTIFNVIALQSMVLFLPSSDGGILNLGSSSRRELCQSLPMQYMGLWVQVRFEDFILSWKTSTHFCEFCALSFTSKYVQRRKERQRWIHWSFIWSKTPMKNIVAIGLSALKGFASKPLDEQYKVKYYFHWN